MKRNDRIITSIYLTKEMCNQIDKMADRGHISRKPTSSKGLLLEYFLAFAKLLTILGKF